MKGLSLANQGILWFLSSRLCFAMAGILIKYFPNSALQFNFVRSSFVLFFVIPVLYFANPNQWDWWSPFKSKNPSLMLIRVVLGSIGLICFYYTFQTMPFAKAFTLAASSTFLTPIFAKIFLKEKIGLYRGLSIAVGYIGVWYALDPVYSGVDLPEFVALLNVVITATVNTISKKLLVKDKPFILMLYAALFSIFLSIVVWSGQGVIHDIMGINPWPDFSLWTYVLLVLLLGPLAFMGQYGYLCAFRKTDLSLLMPYEYTNFVFAALLGYFFFAEIPEKNTWLAMGIIILATSLLAVYEGTTKKRSKKLAK
jgi:drug/metabolite transporter (DMT)-like permease